MKKFYNTMDALFHRWAKWMEKQGFYAMVALCLAIIVGSAIWTRQPSAETPHDSIAVGEADGFQQRLADVMKTPTPQPTITVSPTPQPKWVRPVSGEMLRAFSSSELVYQATMDAWAIHTAVDMAAKPNEAVLSPVDGKVAAITKDVRYGLTVVIKLADGSKLSICGLLSTPKAMGDNVSAGQSIGVAGGSCAAEASDPPHIHIVWQKNDQVLDPSLMWD